MRILLLFSFLHTFTLLYFPPLASAGNDSPPPHTPLEPPGSGDGEKDDTDKGFEHLDNLGEQYNHILPPKLTVSPFSEGTNTPQDDTSSTYGSDDEDYENRKTPEPPHQPEAHHDQPPLNPDYHEPPHQPEAHHDQPPLNPDYQPHLNQPEVHHDQPPVNPNHRPQQPFHPAPPQHGPSGPPGGDKGNGGQNNTKFSGLNYTFDSVPEKPTKRKYMKGVVVDLSANLTELDISIGKDTFASKFLAQHVHLFGDRISGMSGVYVQGYNDLAKFMYNSHSGFFDRKFTGKLVSDNFIGKIADLGPFFLQTPNVTRATKSDYLKSVALSKVQYLLGADFTAVDNIQRLKNMAAALGYNNIKEAPGKSAHSITTSLGTELFWSFGTNVFLFGHLATLMLGYLDSEDYFSSAPTRPFYSWQTLISTGGDGKFEKLDAMCGVIRGSKYTRKDSGFVKPHYKKSRRKNLLSGEPRLLCSMLESVLDSVDRAIKIMGDELNAQGTNIEISVPGDINSKRLQAKLCSNPNDSPINVSCDFTTSRLDHRNKRLMEAFDLLLAGGNLNTGKPEAFIEYLRLIANPFEYDDIFSMTMWWDHREFDGKKGWTSHYRKLRKKSMKRALKGVELKLKFDSAISYYNQLKESESAPKKTAPWARLYLYMSVIMSNSNAMTWAEDTIRSFANLYRMKPSLIMRGEGLRTLLEYCSSDPVALSHIFLYHFLTKRDAGKDLDKDLSAMDRGTLLSRIVTTSSIFIPNKLKKFLKMGARGFFNKKLNTLRAKNTLLRLFPKDLLHSAINAIEFTTHSLATLQISKNMDMWNVLAQLKNPEQGGFAGEIDALFKDWSNNGGYGDYITNKLESGDDLGADDIKKMDIKAPINNDSLNWQKFVNRKISDHLGKFLKIPFVESNAQKNYIYQLVRDSKEKLDENLDQTIFFGKVLPPKKSKNIGKKIFRAAKTLATMLLRSAARPVDHAIWIGVKINIPLVVAISKRLYMLQRDMPRKEAWNLENAFLDILQDLIYMVTCPEKRAPMGFEAMGGNPGLPKISVRYPHMSVEERKIEFQHSQCADHCISIWRSLIAFTLNTFNNPASIKQFEKSLSSNSSLNDISKPEYINSFKYILKGDSVLHMYDNMLPKKVKAEIKSLKHGKAFYFASIMLSASSLFGGMGYPYVSRMLKVQAPYLGNFVVTWDKKRQSSRTSEIAGYLGLGAIASHAVLSGMNIAQHASDVGMGPPETCWFVPRPPPGRNLCIAAPIKSIAASATQTAVQDVFSVGLMATIGPYFIFPMAGVAVWSILKSQFKILDRLQTAFTGLFSRFFTTIGSKKGMRNMKRWFSRRKTLMNKIKNQANEIRTNGGKPDLNSIDTPLLDKEL